MVSEAVAASAYAIIDQAARAMAAMDRETGESKVRSLGQGRADVFVHLLHVQVQAARQAALDALGGLSGEGGVRWIALDPHGRG
jgi:hypothetical protein